MDFAGFWVVLTGKTLTLGGLKLGCAANAPLNRLALLPDIKGC
jgi:hypothetical protein